MTRITDKAMMIAVDRSMRKHHLLLWGAIVVIVAVAGGMFWLGANFGAPIQYPLRYTLETPA